MQVGALDQATDLVQCLRSDSESSTLRLGCGDPFKLINMDHKVAAVLSKLMEGSGVAAKKVRVYRLQKG